eukprot:TRINITY_DN23143_c0_g1_i1.p1 TRINITY_DN23143_c0_g1~~TRINITY_DN23143_c0_g1_i1.p1  ORF type:complete len:400 (-),score=130.70 TRINITY_DN23143_c0_g1_i1:21-1220(-)
MVNFDISANSIEERAALSFARMLSNDCSITSIDLSSCKIAHDGGVAIAAALERNSSLGILRLSDNFLTEKAGIEMLSSFQKNERLTYVNLSGNQVNHSVVVQLREICKSNLKKKKHTEFTPLRLEIIRLRQQQAKIPTTKITLEKAISANDELIASLARKEADLKDMTSEGDRERKSVSQKTEEILKALKEETSKLSEKEAEFSALNLEFDNKLRDANEALKHEIAQREAIEKLIEDIKLKSETSTVQHIDHIKAIQVDIDGVEKDAGERRIHIEEVQKGIKEISDQMKIKKSASRMSKKSSVNLRTETSLAQIANQRQSMISRSASGKLAKSLSKSQSSDSSEGKPGTAGRRKRSKERRKNKIDSQTDEGYTNDENLLTDPMGSGSSESDNEFTLEDL